MEKTVSPTTQNALTWRQVMNRKLVFSLLNKIEKVHLRLTEDFATSTTYYEFGPADSSLSAEIRIHDVKAYQCLISGGSIGAAEAYIEHLWSSPNLTRLIEAFVLCQEQLDALENKTPWLQKIKNNWFHWRNKNSNQQAKKNILAHYDLGNELYQRFLDPEMMYSSAIYPDPHCDLDQAQLHKLDLICQRLELTKEDHLIEIGTGWGGLAIYAATKYGCKVTTTTISDAQYQFALDRVKSLGLEDKITLLKQDYRLLEGKYDKLVSVEMIEAVGHQYYSTFFNKCNSLLKSGGKMLIQAITIADQRFEHYKNNVDFIQRYIFPGGCLPSIEVMAQHLRKDTQMVVHELHDIGLDYAKTLAHWRHRFHLNWHELKQLGFDEPFKRLWEFYLSYCEGAFLQRATSTVHLIARK